ncbi:MAG: hypothetical protein ABSA04_11035 [Desulfobaccales bacterium]|jgi:hypothetical protein
MKKLSGRRGLCGLFLTMAFWCGCTASPFAAPPPLSVAAAQHTLDAWNPSYCKVAEFYGFFQPESSATRVAYVSIVNPGDKAQKAAVYNATFQLLSRADGQQQWFLTEVVTHSSGILTKRQGWDTLMVPVQEAPPAAVQKKS